MSKTLLDSASELFQPQLPLWACEFTSHHFIVAGVDSKRNRIIGRTTVDASEGAVVGSLLEKNFRDPAAALGLVRNGLSEAGSRAFKGSEIGVVIPDDSARIAFLTAENLPAGQKEREAFVRWKLKKSTPFDTDNAQVAFKILGSHVRGEVHGVDLLVALSPRVVIDEYIDLMEKVNLQAGYVIPSTLAALNLLPPPVRDSLFVKIAPGSITTTVFQKQRLQFYRRVSEMPLYDAVYPTIMYYQDKLMGSGLERVTVCSYAGDAGPAMTELQEKLGLPVDRLDPKNVEDMFKPTLGAVGFAGAGRLSDGH